MTAARKPIKTPTVAVCPTDEPDPFLGGYVRSNVLDSEGVFLSHCLMHPAQFGLLLLMVRPEHFYATCNQRVMEGIIGACEQGGGDFDVVTVANWMRSHGTLTQSGGSPYLATLVDCTPATANPALHAEQIKEAWRQRTLFECMTRQAILLRHGQATHADCYAALKEHFKVTK
jgi:replicative DNA helicase